ncbi:MAG: bifunctional glycosyltransferase family 2/GtrA family protein, partial [Pseudomonadota bacterium]
AEQLERIAIIIPAFNPATSLLQLVDELLQYRYAALIIVDDGSRPDCEPIFKAIANHDRVTLLRHAVNSGKGRALKTAFNYCMLHPTLHGVVTADADGQHKADDIARVAMALVQQSEPALVLGVREFSDNVPLRSKFGNELTRLVFRALYGLRVRDTQTGLRGLPLSTLGVWINIAGERYEFESTMLIEAINHHVPVHEVAIATIYLDNNSSSHFDVLRDSMKIYFVLLRFLLSSLLTSGVDFLVFSLALTLTGSVGAGMLWGRGIAQFVNFLVNQRLVFRQRKGGYAAFARYLALVAVLGTFSYLMITEMQERFGLNPLIAKLLAESILFVISFSTQHNLVFAVPRQPNEEAQR